MSAPVKAVVIGASAGGVEAINALFASLRRPLPMPVIVALHIPPRGSIILGAFSAGKMPVKEAEDKESLEPGVVYFAPPNYHLLVESDETLSLSVEDPVHFARPSIDVLYESAGEVYGENLLAILLTGANEDGAAGLAQIHRNGGFTVVQDPATAQAREMPQAALNLFQPSMIAGLEEIGRVLARVGEGEGAHA